MDFDDRDGHGQKRIEDCAGSMGIGGGIDDDPGDIATVALEPINDFALVIALMKLQGEAAGGRLGTQALFDLTEGERAVDFRLAFGEQIQIGAVDYDDRSIQAILRFTAATAAANSR